VEEPSILYDTIMFGILYFNEDEYINSNLNLLNSKKFSLFHQYRDNANYKIKNLLSPFFYYKKRRRSLLMAFLIKKLEIYNIRNYNLDSFIKDLLADEFHHFVLSYFLQDENVDNYSDRQNFLDRLDELKYKSHLIARINNLAIDFDDTLSDLVDVLNRIHKIAKEAHRGNKPIIDKILKDCKEEKVIAFFSSVFLTPKEEYKDRPVIITLFVVTTCTVMDIGEIVGLEFKDVLEGVNNYKRVTMESYCKLFSNKSILELSNIMKNGEEINAKAASDLLHISSTAVVRYLKIMLKENVLIVTRKTSTSIYYVLNKEYFKKVIEMQTEYYNEINE
jgi:hypothetical protein